MRNGHPRGGHSSGSPTASTVAGFSASTVPVAALIRSGVATDCTLAPASAKQRNGTLSVANRPAGKPRNSGVMSSPMPANDSLSGPDSASGRTSSRSAKALLSWRVKSAAGPSTDRLASPVQARRLAQFPKLAMSPPLTSEIARDRRAAVRPTAPSTQLSGTWQLQSAPVTGIDALPRFRGSFR